MNEAKRGCFEKLVQNYDEFYKILQRMLREYFKMEIETNFEGDTWKTQFLECVRNGAKGSHPKNYMGAWKKIQAKSMEKYDISDMDASIICTVLAWEKDFKPGDFTMQRMIKDLASNRNHLQHNEYDIDDISDDNLDNSADEMKDFASNFITSSKNFISALQDLEEGKPRNAPQSERDKYYEKFFKIIDDAAVKFNECYKEYIRTEGEKKTIETDRPEGEPDNTEDRSASEKTENGTVAEEIVTASAEGSSEKEESHLNFENNYTQINNPNINVNNVVYSSSESNTAVVANRNKAPFDWKKYLKIIIPVAVVIILISGVLAFNVIKSLFSIHSRERESSTLVTTNVEEPSENDKVLTDDRNEKDTATDTEKNDSNATEDLKKTLLTNMEIVERNHGNTEIKDSVEDTLGNKYNNALCLEYYTSPGYAKYYLSGKYKRFRCNFACEDGSYNGNFRLKIYSDNENEPLYLLDYTRALPVTPIDIDVTGVEFITFEVSGGDIYYGGIIADGIFYVDNADDNLVSAKEEEVLQDTKISRMEIVERNHGNTGIKDSIKDTLGNKYNNALCLEYYTSPGYAKYYLGGKYKRFRCNFSCENDSYNGNFRLKIYSDNENEPLYLLDYTRMLPVTPIDIDVTGVEFITFEVSGGDIYYGGIISEGIFCVNDTSNELNSSANDAPVKDTKITSMTIVERNHGNAGFYDSVEDTLGNKYNNALCLEYYTSPGYAAFYLGEKYKRFKGNFVCGDSYDGNYRFEIFGDNTNDPIYTLDYSKSLPVTPIDIDVTGVDFITFKVSSDAIFYSGIVSDGTFWVE